MSPKIARKTHKELILYNKQTTYAERIRRYGDLEDNLLRSFEPIPLATPPLPYNRKIDTALLRIRTGHTFLTHSHLFTKEPSPTCSHCNSPLTIIHIFLKCPLYTNIRRSLNFSQKSSPNILLLSEIIAAFLTSSNIFPKI